jgi:hypothetical protein
MYPTLSRQPGVPGCQKYLPQRTMRNSLLSGKPADVPVVFDRIQMLIQEIDQTQMQKV